MVGGNKEKKRNFLYTVWIIIIFRRKKFYQIVFKYIYGCMCLCVCERERERERELSRNNLGVLKGKVSLYY